MTVSGVWDAVNRQLRIAVLSQNESLVVGSTIYVPPADDVSSAGAIVVGSATSSNVRSDVFDGYVADVAAYPTALPGSLLRQLPVPLP